MSIVCEHLTVQSRVRVSLWEYIIYLCMSDMCMYVLLVGRFHHLSDGCCRTRAAEEGESAVST